MFKFFKKRQIRKQLLADVKESVKNGPYSNTLYNSDWLIDNQEEILKSLPDTWTHIDNFDYVEFGISMSSIGLPWKDKSDLLNFLGYFEMISMLITQNVYQIRRCYNNPFTIAYNDIRKLKL